MSLLRSGAFRATVGFVVVMIALIIAMWPRDHDSSSPADSQPSATAVETRQVSDSELAEARTKGNLLPCPTGTGATPSGAALAGIEVPCLGDGQTIDIGRALAGRPTVINVWANWCGPCRAELPHFNELALRAGERLNVIGVQAYTGSLPPYESLQFLYGLNVRLAAVTDVSGRIRAALDAPPVYPSTFFLRADGTVAHIEASVFESEEDLLAAVKTRLGVDLGAS